MVKPRRLKKKIVSTLNDVSPRAVVAMLLLVVIVSTLSLIMYLDTLEKVKPKVVLNGGKVSGEVSLTLFPSSGAPQPGPKAQGEVHLTIVEPLREK